MAEANHRLTPWQKIVRAAERGTGTRLSAHEVGRLAKDDAIAIRADLDDHYDAEWERDTPSDGPMIPTQEPDA